MNENRNVKFIRKNGRVIPIRLTNDQKQQVKGAAIVAAGVGVSAAGGRVYKAVVKKSASMAFKGFNILDRMRKSSGPAQMSLFDVGKLSKAQKAAEASLRTGKKLGSISKGIRFGATAAGAGLIGFGAAKIIKTFSDDRKYNISPEILAGGAAAAGAIIPKAYDLSKSSFTAGMMNKQTAMRFSSQKWTQYSPKLKGLVLKALKSGI